MPPYDLPGLEAIIFMTGIGIVIVAAIALARGSRWMGFSFTERSDKELEETVHEFGGGVSETDRPVPWLIWLVFLGYFIWAACYVIFSGVLGLPG